MSLFRFRVGHGFDVHRFAAGTPLILGGVEIPGEVGLEGHSDADVVLHALTDAILGACGAGDIGQHFPPSDPQWRGAASSRFVRHALELARARQFALVNCDVTLVGERPRLGPHRSRVHARLAELLDLPSDRVNIKATTTEGLGWAGRREGLACHAVVLLGPDA